MAARIEVDAPGGSYTIQIERGCLARLRELLPDHKHRVIVTNTTLAELYAESLMVWLPDTVIITIPDGEAHKTLETTAQLYADFVAARVDRSSLVIAFGGGVVGDVAGFAASTYMRGVDFVQIPTSLLAMVDSSVGGKVGVDLPQGKNLVGAFKQPQTVIIDPDVLRTLTEREWRCGMAEVIKHGLLADAGLLDSALWSPDLAEQLVRQAVQVKVDIVQQDPYEQGIRAHLNLGHTFGHAIEHVSGYRWAHGEAVAIGLIAAVRTSAQLGLCDAALSGYVEDTLQKVGLPLRMGDLSVDTIYAVMSTDKKWQNGKSRFVLLRRVGQAEIVEGIPREVVYDVLNGLRD